VILLFLFGCISDDTHGPEQNTTTNSVVDDNNTSIIEEGCDPVCDAKYDCISNSCILKQGCDYDNPACDHDYNCIGNECILKKGCQYNNPRCDSEYNCINNDCVLKKGCQYANPKCDEGYECINNYCILEPSESGSISIKGEVVDSTGSGISGATVQLTSQSVSNGKIYRMYILDEKTTADGSFYFSDSDITEGELGYRLGEPPYYFFLTIYKEGYIDEFIYDYDETPKELSSGEWNVGKITLSDLGTRNEMSEGRFTVKYYDGDEECAEIAMDSMQEYYPQVMEILEVEPYSDTTDFTFNTILEQGYGDWLGSSNGIWTVCYPWTDNIDNPQIADMWNTAIPHEMAHHVQLYLKKPYWAEEGIAQYTTKTINDEIDCSEEFVSIVDLHGENMPAYDSAACAFHMLEQEQPGFFQELLQTMEDDNTNCNRESGYFIKTTMSDVYGSDLTEYFVGNFGFDTETLEDENHCP